MTDYPDGTLPMAIRVEAEILSQVRQLPWWVRYNPSRVVYLDDFEGVMKWIETEATMARENSDRVFEGSYALSLTTAAGAGASSSANIWLGGVPRSKFALQLRWNVLNNDDEALRSIRFAMRLSDGINRSFAEVQYLNYLNTVAQNKWQYYGTGDAFHDIPDADEPFQAIYGAHQPLYLVVDFGAALKYVRLVTSYLDLDLSAISFNHATTTEPPYLELAIYVATDKAVAVKAAIDAVIVSDQEA